VCLRGALERIEEEEDHDILKAEEPAIGYIFDFGGTLDTGGCHWGKVLWHAYERCRVGVTEAQFREAYVYAERTMGRLPLVQPTFTMPDTLAVKLRLQFGFLADQGYWQPSAGNAQCEAVLADVCALAASHVAHSREVLQRLKGQGSPLALVSNFYGNLPAVLRHYGLDTCFDAVIESAAVGVRKPDPRIFRLGVEALGLQPAEVTVVGDSLANDIVPAGSIGCSTVWLEGEQWSDIPVDRSLPSRVIADLDELA
jgi:putative hydrolase of the HAD superfamily